jgi:hypothetical protein
MRLIASICAVLVALFGGAYLGFSSCGGVLSHQYAIIAALSALTVIAIAIPPQGSRPFVSGALIVLGIAAIFIFSRAAAAPFYPAAPDSLSMFLQVFSRALAGDVC